MSGQEGQSGAEKPLPRPSEVSTIGMEDIPQHKARIDENLTSTVDAMSALPNSPGGAQPIVFEGSPKIAKRDDSVDMSWENMCFEVPGQKILQSIHGFVPSGRMLAILGPSGAGKTSLLSMLSGKVMAGKVSGTILLNDTVVGAKELTTSKIRDHISIVEQHDLFVGELTIQEHLDFHAQLRLHEKTSTQRKEAVKNVTERLGIDHRLGTRIMLLSGGEKKRLAIAEELLNDPPVLLLDEPTSGLDSHMALEVITVLKKINKTCIMTIHQPSTSIWNSFDYILLLSGGKVFFMDEAKLFISYFKNAGHPCPAYTNPAEYALDFLNAPPPEMEVQVDPRKVKFESAYSLADVPVKGRAPLLHEFCAVFKRAFIERIRKRLATKLNLITAAVLSTYTGVIFFQLGRFDGPDGKLSQEGVKNRIGAMFLLGIHPIFTALFGASLAMIAVHPTILREYRVKHLYRLFPFYCGRTLGEAPIQLLIPTVYAAIGYWMVFSYITPSFGSFILYWLSLLSGTFCGDSLGYFAGTLGTDFDLGITYTILLALPMFLFSGNLSNPNQVPVWLRWMRYLSVFYWTFRAMAVPIWEGVTDIAPCTEDSECIAFSGDQYLKETGLTPNYYWDGIFSIGMNLVLGFSFRTLGYLRLHFRHVMNDKLFSILQCCRRRKIQEERPSLKSIVVNDDAEKDPEPKNSV